MLLIIESYYDQLRLGEGIGRPFISNGFDKTGVIYAKNICGCCGEWNRNEYAAIDKATKLLCT